MLKLTDFEAISFDCYGTLIDWETGILDSLDDLVSRSGLSLKVDEILQSHAKFESAQQVISPRMLYRDLLAVVYERLAGEWGVTVSTAECVAYGFSVGDWEPFKDTKEALRFLKTRYRLFILSNVDNENFVRSNKKLGIEFDGVFTAEDIGTYKPSENNFEYLLSEVAGRGIEKASLLHTAESLFHDHVPAKKMGLSTCLINRRHGKKGFGATMAPGEFAGFDFGFESLGEFVEAIKGTQG